MTACTGLARFGKKYAPYTSNLRQALRRQAVEAGFASPRIWMELLEPRRMMDATAATVALDPTFGQGGMARPLLPTQTELHSPYSNLTPAGEGKFYAVIYGNPMSFPPGYGAIDLVRLNANGSLDSSFTPAHYANQSPLFIYSANGPEQIMADDSLMVNSLLVQPDGKVLLAVRDAPQFSPDPFLLMRFNTDGSPDMKFGTNGIEELPVDPNTAGLPVLSLTSSGKMDVMNVSYFNTSDNASMAIRQMNSDGTTDTSFGTDGQLSIDIPTDLHSFIVNSGSPYSAWTAKPIGFTRLADDSSEIYLQNEAQGGYGTSLNGMIRSELFQLHLGSAGEILSMNTVDSSDIPWAFTGPHAPSPVVAMQPDGKALIFNAHSGSFQRFGLDGTLDATFRANLKSPFLKQILPQADGTLLLSIGSDFYTGIERLRSDGSIDNSFATGQPIFGFAQGLGVTDAVTLTDGSIIASVSIPGVPDDFLYNLGRKVMMSLAKILPTGGTPNTFDVQAAEAAAQAKYEAANAPPVIISDPIPSTDGGTPVDTTTSGDPSTDPTFDPTSQDGNNASDLSADPLAGAGLADGGADSLSTPAGYNLFDHAVGSTLFDPAGARKVFEDGLLIL